MYVIYSEIVKISGSGGENDTILVERDTIRLSRSLCERFVFTSVSPRDTDRGVRCEWI